MEDEPCEREFSREPQSKIDGESEATMKNYHRSCVQSLTVPTLTIERYDR